MDWHSECTRPRARETASLTGALAMWVFALIIAVVAVVAIVAFVHGAARAGSRAHTRLDIGVDSQETRRRDAA